MTLTEALQSAQFVIDNEGRRNAVLLDIQAWEKLITWLEDMTDIKLSVHALSKLQEAGGRPQQAGWLAWDDISEEWENEEVETETSTV